MANVYSGRQLILNTTGVIPLANFKVTDAWWTNMAMAATFTMVDEAGRVFTYTSYAANYPQDLGNLNWMSGPVTITALSSGTVYLILGK